MRLFSLKVHNDDTNNTLFRVSPLKFFIPLNLLHSLHAKILRREEVDVLT